MTTRCAFALLGLSLLVADIPAQAPQKPVSSIIVSSDGKIKTRLSAAEELKQFTVPDGFTIELVAEEPLVINPITMTLDDKGRILVSESHTYRYGPNGSPVKPFKNPVVRLDPKPDGKGYDRVLIADGFDDPVMGIAVKGDKLWLTACNYLYQYDYSDTGLATNRKTLVVDKNKAWNPFGMFVLEWGPDGLLYMSVGDHKIALEGPTNKATGRGNSGIIVRMNPDGSNMERLTHGFRVPYSFEFDPFGQLWLLSNGEGNPDRFARIIPGVDYCCYSRPKIDNAWLAGNNPLAPPVTELMRGAHTQLLRYYGDAYPTNYQGSLFLCNWGAHGFAGPNRCIFRFRPDDRGQIVERDVFVKCNDPHFRPSHIVLDQDGNLLINDWYGRDDESDLTGRIWRVRRTGPRETPAERLPAIPTQAQWVKALGSTHHLDRERAMQHFVKQGNATAIQILGEHAAKSTNSLGSANALWALVRIGNDSSKATILDGVSNSDPRVRRLALDLAHQFEGDPARPVPLYVSLRDLAKNLVISDPDPAVRVQAAIILASTDPKVRPENGAKLLADVLVSGAAKDVHLRYQTAAALAKVAKLEELNALLASNDPDIRLAGLIAIDVACWEGYPTKTDALAALSQMLTNKNADSLISAIFLVQQHGDKAMLPDLEKLILRDDLPTAVTGKAMVAYRGIAGKLPAVAGKRFLDAIQKGTIALTTPADHFALLDVLESEGPTAVSIEQLAKELRGKDPKVKPAALALARRFAPKSGPLADALWPSIFTPGKGEDTLDVLSTVAVIQSPAVPELWTKLLNSTDPLVRTDAVRWWRVFKKQPELVKVLVDQAPALAKADPELRDDLATVLRELGAAVPEIPADDGKRDKKELAQITAKALSARSADSEKHVRLGKQVFERALCTKCHTTVSQNTPLAPSLKGIGAQKLDYLIESVLEPSKIIKTGFETETVVTTAGKTLSGLVKDEGTHLRVQNLDLDVRIPKAEVEQRSVQRISIMPEGQEAQLSRREFIDLIAYLQSLR
jgi:putative membrane-bound dehydrogenase-like protein